MRRAWIILSMMLIPVCYVFTVNLLNVNPEVSQNSISIYLEFDSTPVYNVRSDFSKTTFTMEVKDASTTLSNTMFPVRIGPLEMVSFFTVGESLMISFHTIVPSSPTFESSGSTVKVEFKRSTTRIDVVFSNEMDLKTDISYIAEYLNLNVIVSPSVAGLRLDMKLNDVTPEDALRNLFLSLKGVYYSYFPDGTMFVGTYEDVSSRFLKFWGVYYVKPDEKIEEKLADIVSEFLPQNAMLSYIKNKSLLFIYGGPEIHRLVTSIISKKPLETEKVYDYGSIKSENVKSFLDSLKTIYPDFDYVFVPGTSRVIIKGKSSVVETVIDYLSSMFNSSVKMRPGKLVVRVKNIEEAEKILGSKHDLKIERLDSNTLSITGPDEILSDAVKLLDEKGVLSEGWNSFTLPFKLDEVKDAVESFKDMSGLSEDDVFVLQVPGTDNTVVYFKGDPDKTEIFRKLLINFSKMKRTERKVKRIEYLDMPGISEDVKSYVEKSFGVELTVLKSIEKVVVSGESESVEKALDFLSKYVEGTKKTSKILDLGVTGDELNGIVSALKRLYGDSVDVEGFPNIGTVILESSDPEALDRASFTAWSLASSIKRRKEEQELEKEKTTAPVQRVVEEEEKKPPSSLVIDLEIPKDAAEQVKSYIESVSGNAVSMEYFSLLKKVVLTSEDETALKKAANFLRELEGVIEDLKERESVEREPGKVINVVKVDNLAPDQVEKIAKLFGVEVVPLDGIYVLAGYEKNISDMSNLLKELSKCTVKELDVETFEKPISFPEEVLNEMKKRFSDLIVLDLESGILVYGDAENVKRFSEIYKRAVEMVPEPENPEISYRILEKPKNLSFEKLRDLADALKVKLYDLDDFCLAMGNSEDIERLSSILLDLSERAPKSTVAILDRPDQISEDVLKKLSGFYPSVGVLVIGSKVVLVGKDTDVREFSKVYGMILSNIPKPVEKAPQEPETFILERVGKFAYSDFSELLKTLGLNVRSAYLESVGMLVLVGKENELENAEKFINDFKLKEVKPKEEKIIYEVLDYPENFPAEVFVSSLDGIFKSTTVRLIKELKVLVIVSKDQKEYGEFMKMFKSLVERSEKIVRIPVKSESSKELVYEFFRTEEDFPIDSFSNTVKLLVKESHVIPYKGVGYTLVVTYSKSDMKKIEKIYEEIESRLEILRESRMETQVSTPTTPTEVVKPKEVWMEDGLVYIDVEDKPLIDLLKELFDVAEKSVVFKKVPDISVSVRIDGMSFEKVLEILREYGITVSTKDGVYIISELEEKPKEPEGPKVVYHVMKAYHNFDRIKSLVEYFGGKAYLDEDTGTLIITGITDDQVLKTVDSLLKEVSTPLKQIEIEARIIDRSLLEEIAKKTEININLPLKGDENVQIISGGLNLNTSVISAQDYENLLEAISKASVSFNLESWKQNNLGNLLASPKIVTSSGKEARILIGERIPYIVQTPDGRTEVRFVEPGIELKITPVAREDGTIELKVFTKVSNPVWGEVRTMPGENTREAQTDVIVKDGDTLVIGGLIREDDAKSVNKMPLLGDLPLIGSLFRTESDRKEKRELIIFITAKVVSEW